MHILLIVINNHILTFKQFGESCPIIVCIFFARGGDWGELIDFEGHAFLSSLSGIDWRSAQY